jgi:thiol-disulfide isomerase/thioredoxin
MKKYLPVILIFVTFTALIIGTAIINIINESKEKTGPINQNELFNTHFAKLTVKSVEGESIVLSQIKSPIVIVNFWASWCTPCLEEMATLVELRRHFKPREIQILGVNGDEMDQLKQITKVKKKLKINYPIIADLEGTLFNQFLISSLPRTLIFLKGKLQEIEDEFVDFSSIENINLFKKLLNST